MPLLRIETNQPAADIDRLLKTASELVAHQLGKPEAFVMISYQHTPHMVFGGTSAPLAYLELKSIGLPEQETSEISAALCNLMEQELGVPRDRTYVAFANAERHMWGFKGTTF